MANNERFLLDQFAGEANNNGVFGSYEADNATVSNDPDTLQSLPAYKTGWENATTSGSKLPRLEEMQGLQYLLCKAIKELYSEGIPFWMAGETYYTNSICMYFDSEHDFALYKNISGENGNNIPPVDTVNWKPCLSSNIANWSSNVSNCITEIPQDIKLELNNGTLTLKAGSKVYVPNGAGVFDELVINSDKTVSISSFSGFVFYRSDNNGIHLETLQPTSGTTPPSGEGTWYDTNANKIKRYENSSFVYDGISFPLCKCSSGSIDQVFNGFGYIGSTVFALPGVKWLGTNGKNADDTLKSVMCSNSNIMLHTWGSDARTDLGILFLQDNIEISDAGSIKDWKYYEKENYWSENNLTSINKFCALGYISLSEGKILSFNPRGVFHAVDYNDKEFIGHQAMPSNRYIDLTLGASGTTYTSPADGYFSIALDMASYGNVGLSNNSARLYNWQQNTSEGYLDSFVLAKKGDNITVHYKNMNSVRHFLFIFSESSK